MADDSNLLNHPAMRAEITRVLQTVAGESSEALLELVYDQLRQLARSRLAKEPQRGAGITLEATALVHEAYLRVVGSNTESPKPQIWQNRGHFFGAAALAMRRILVERARHRRRLKHGGGKSAVELQPEIVPATPSDFGQTDLLALDEALAKLETLDPRKAKVVSLRYFAGLTVEETARALDLSEATVKNEWAFARAWLHRELGGAQASSSSDTAR